MEVAGVRVPEYVTAPIAPSRRDGTAEKSRLFEVPDVSAATPVEAGLMRERNAWSIAYPAAAAHSITRQ